MRVDLVTIDAQNDFCDPNGALYVNGANDDCERLANMINRLKNKIDHIHITLDSHHEVDIAHPIFWRNSNGENPDPFTIISKDDVENGTWTPSLIGARNKALNYVRELEKNKRYPLCIWPPHCIIGSWGYQLDNRVSDAVREWSKAKLNKVNFVTKGSNPFTEHYSAIKADVPDHTDPTTLVNTPFINTLAESDMVLITGQALSHCVANTVRDIVDEVGSNYAKKLVLIEDTTSNVPGFESLGEDFIENMKSEGMKIEKADTVLT
jgi:nicotinamidase/pyrazinamidase